MTRVERREPAGKRNVYIALCAAAVIGVLLRAIYLNKACYEIEQATWLFYAKQPTGAMFEWLKYELTGVLDIVILHVLCRVSDNPAFLKSYQIVLFLPVIWYVYRLSELIFEDARPGVAAAFMTALSPLCIHHAQLLRYHSLAMFASVGAVCYFAEYAAGGKRKHLALFVAFFFMGAAAHYYPVVLLPSLALGALAGSMTGKFSFKRSAAACLLAGSSLCALVPLFLSQYARRVGEPSGASSLFNYIFSRALLNIPDAFLQLSLGTYYQIHSDSALARILLWGAILAYIIAVAALILTFKLWLRGPRLFFATATALAVALPFLTVPFAGALYSAKFLVPFAPLFFLLFAGLVFSCKSPALKYGALGLILCVFCVSTARYYQALGPRPDFHDSIRYIELGIKPGDTVVVSPGYYFMLFDLYRSVRINILSVPQGDFLKDKSKSKQVITGGAMEALFKEKLAGKKRVWVFYGDGSGKDSRIPMDPGCLTYKWFERNYKPVFTYNFYISPIKAEGVGPLGIVRLYEK